MLVGAYPANYQEPPFVYHARIATANHACNLQIRPLQKPPCGMSSFIAAYSSSLPRSTKSSTPSMSSTMSSTPTVSSPAGVLSRVQDMWNQPSMFGEEDAPHKVYLNIVANRYALVRGTQLLRDELMLSFNKPGYTCKLDGEEVTGVAQCPADLGLPSVLTTCGYTMCGDRICQSNSLRRYQSMVAGRFGSITEGGEMKPELFFATGGGTDSGPTLAHVTVGHAMDKPIQDMLYSQNSESCFLVNIDVCTHCGHLDVGEGNRADFAGKRYENVGVIYGLAQESGFRDPRPACGAVVGMLTNFNLKNPVHVRLRNDLGEDNFKYLSKNDVLADDGSPVTFLIASAIIAIQGMRNTLDALGPGGELDERGLGHMTAHVQVNNRENEETLLYCARATVCNGQIIEQGLGTDATKWSAQMCTDVQGRKRVKFLYDGTDDFPVEVRPYTMKASTKAKAPEECDETGNDIHLRKSGERTPLSAAGSARPLRTRRLQEAPRTPRTPRASKGEDPYASDSSRSDCSRARTFERSGSHQNLADLAESKPRKRTSSKRPSRASLGGDPERLHRELQSAAQAVAAPAEGAVAVAGNQGTSMNFWWACLTISAIYIALLAFAGFWVMSSKAVTN